MLKTFRNPPSTFRRYARVPTTTIARTPVKRNSFCFDFGDLVISNGFLQEQLALPGASYQQNRNPLKRVPENPSSFPLLLFALVGQLLTISAHELLNATSGVNKLLLSSVEGMAECGDVNVDDRILDPVDDLCVIGLVGGNAGPLMFAIDEKYRICSGMDSCFHCAA